MNKNGTKNKITKVKKKKTLAQPIILLLLIRSHIQARSLLR